jgi:hypothetical protein
VIECLNYTCIKPACPYDFECCNDDEYAEEKACRSGYVCLANRCVYLDYDDDGLADVVEENYGTNKTLYDSDGDGLSDKHEIKTSKTDPLDDNTDDDRYIDGEDDRPLDVDTADVLVAVVSSEIRKNNSLLHELLLHLDFNQPIPHNDSLVAEYESNVLFLNNGTDYTTNITYNHTLGFWCAKGIEVRRKPFIFPFYNATNETVYNITDPGARGFSNTTSPANWTLKSKFYIHPRLDAGVRYTKHFFHRLYFRDLTNETMLPLVSERRCFYNVTITNLDYETFPSTITIS